MEFVDFEAPVASNNKVSSDNEVGSEDEVSDINSLKSFIDDNMEIEEVRTYYWNFENVTKLVDETLVEEFYESIREIENFDEVSNFCDSSEEEGQTDEFKDVEKSIEKFEETLHSNGEEKAISPIVYAISFVLRFDVSDKIDACIESELQETIGSGSFWKLFDNKDKFMLELDNPKFHLQCMEINDILADCSFFLRVYALKKNSDN